MNLTPALVQAYVTKGGNDPFVSITLITESATFNLAWHATPEQLRQLATQLETPREEAA